MTREEILIKEEILAAPDRIEVVADEAVTEPLGASKGMCRAFRRDFSSSTVHPGKTYRLFLHFSNGPESKAWAALSGFSEMIL